MKVEKQNKKQNLSLGDSEIVERKSSIIDNRPEAIMRRKMINDIRVTNKNTFIADNRLKIGIQRRVLNVINAPHSARSMRVIQRALWKYDGRQWECYKGEGSSISHIEGSTGNIYDDETETFYSDEAEYENVQGLLSELGALGFSGQLSILENDIKGTAYPDFKEKMIVSIKKLIQKELGRKLIMDIAKGGFAVTIRPSNEDTEPHANPTWREREETGNRTGERNEKEEPGEGVEATVVIPAAMDDSSFQCYNADFELCDEPLFVILGHELIHAYHMTKGEAYSNSIKPDTDPEYDNKEEEKTIATDPLFSENMIRTEHGFMPRFGHDGIEILDETIDLASSGVTKIREVIALFGISMDFLFEKNPALLSKLFDNNEIIKDYLQRNTWLLHKFRSELETTNWRQYFKANPKELEPIMTQKGAYKGWKGMSDHTFEALYEQDNEGYISLCQELHDNQLDNISLDDSLGILIKKFPKLEGLINKHIHFIKKEQVDKCIEDVATVETGDGQLYIDDKYKMTELVMVYNPHLAASVLSENYESSELFKKIRGVEPLIKFQQKIVQSYTNINDLEVSTNKLCIPPLKRHRITKAQAKDGKDKCIEKLSEKFNMDVKLLKEYNKASNFAAGSKIIVR